MQCSFVEEVSWELVSDHIATINGSIAADFTGCSHYDYWDNLMSSGSITKARLYLCDNPDLLYLSDSVISYRIIAGETSGGEVAAAVTSSSQSVSLVWVLAGFVAVLVVLTAILACLNIVYLLRAGRKRECKDVGVQTTEIEEVVQTIEIKEEKYVTGSVDFTI